ncbi:hypothetical protein ONE63_010028 [Megalurothrips usitatus]|uniref:Uncharacterized protein n=1 Tax=Megalurothrips usitatus TaxID=439358 RepID=A0AAV7XN25_9NEOP|nr:hypothetical protein ONE63_010028 [Megalurothrips usitatus]
MAVFVHEERQVLAGQDNNTEPYDSTILEADTITPTTMVFNVMVIMCSVVGLASCPPLVYGIYTDRRQLLVPWIVAVVIGSVVDVAHVVYLIYIELVSIASTENNFGAFLSYFLFVFFFEGGGEGSKPYNYFRRGSACFDAIFRSFFRPLFFLRLCAAALIG